MPQQSSFKKQKGERSVLISSQKLKVNKSGSRTFLDLSIVKNRHGKRIEQRKGKFQKQGKQKSQNLTKLMKQSLAMTKEVNLKNELEFARRATSSGGTMRIVKAPAKDPTEQTRKGPKPQKKKKAQTVIGVGGKRM
jgi:hypothetical protein